MRKGAISRAIDKVERELSPSRHAKAFLQGVRGHKSAEAYITHIRSFSIFTNNPLVKPLSWLSNRDGDPDTIAQDRKQFLFLRNMRISPDKMRSVSLSTRRTAIRSYLRIQPC